MLNPVPALLRSRALLLLLGSAAAGAAPSWQATEKLPGQLRINGVVVEVERVVCVVDAATQLARLRAGWAQAAPQIRWPEPQRQGSWWLLDRVSGRWHETWQLRDRADGGAEGYRSRVDLGAAPYRPAAPPLMLPAGARVQSVVENIEGARAFRQWSIRLGNSGRSDRVLRGLLEAAALRAGWTAVDPSVPAPPWRWQRPHAEFSCTPVVDGDGRWLICHQMEEA